MQSDIGKLFIGGISWETNEERLKEYFSTYGEVAEAVILKDRTTGRARGFGFVVFADATIAEKVVKEKHSIDGRMVEAKKAVPRDDQTSLSRNSGSFQGSPGPVRTRKIFVGGLASAVTESEFRNYFEQFGAITDIVIMYDHNTKRPRGFGFITYDSEEAVDRVLIKTFHELSGKMVEVKRAVPKELSPGLSSSPLPAGYNNYGMTRLNNFLSPSSNSFGGYGVRMDGRFSPVASNRTGFPPFGSAYGMGMNLEVGLNPNYVGNTNISNNLSYGRGLNPYFIANSNGFPNPVGVGYDGGNGGNSSFFSSATRNLWSNGGVNYVANSANTNFEGSGGNLNLRNSNNWGSLTNQTNRVAENSNHSLGGRDNGGNRVATSLAYTSSPRNNGGYDQVFSDFNSFYGDSTWNSATPRRDDSFSYALGNSASDISTKRSAGVVGGYILNKRQPNRGIAT